MEIKTVSKKRKLLPSLDMTREEFITHLSKAEEGPFYTLEEGQEMIRQWREQRRNQ